MNYVRLNGLVFFNSEKLQFFAPLPFNRPNDHEDHALKSSFCQRRKTNTSSTAHNNQSLEVCFVIASYVASVDKADKIGNVTDFRLAAPHFGFYAFTNSETLVTPGWSKILTNFSYRRYITHSRHPKFLAWKTPMIETCEVVFYHDAYLNPLPDVKLWNSVASMVKNSTYGLLQERHPRKVKMNGEGPILEELSAILGSKKDIEQNVNAARKWLQQQPDFNQRALLYANTFFGYDPCSGYYRTLSQEFWNRYSLELDSWRDQPLWSYTLDRLNITPAVLPYPHTRLFHIGRMGHGGHKYSSTSDFDASQAISTRNLKH